jgi:predicted ArsR family transcriptional regulator
MTRTYILRKLLEHGSLTLPQIAEITGWTSKKAHRALEDLMADGTVVAEGRKMKMVYGLVAHRGVA